MQIQHEDDGHKGRFYINEDGKDVAEMVYAWREGVMVIVHTEVDPSLEGRGVGRRLVKAAADYARQHKIFIKPVCPYAKKVMERGAEYADVLEQ